MHWAMGFERTGPVAIANMAAGAFQPNRDVFTWAGAFEFDMEYATGFAAHVVSMRPGVPRGLLYECEEGTLGLYGSKIEIRDRNGKDIARNVLRDWKAVYRRGDSNLLHAHCAHRLCDRPNGLLERPGTDGNRVLHVHVPFFSRVQASRAAAKLAAQFRAPYLTLHAGYLDERSPSAVATFTDRVKYLADVCGENGLQLLLETGQETADDLVRFLGTVKGVGVNFDPANMLLYGMGDPVAAVAKLAPWIRHVHAKDATPSPQPGVAWGNEVPWGEGRVNAPAFLAALKKAGYAGAIAVERESGTDRMADIALAVRRLAASS